MGMLNAALHGLLIVLYYLITSHHRYGVVQEGHTLQNATPNPVILTHVVSKWCQNLAYSVLASAACITYRSVSGLLAIRLGCLIMVRAAAATEGRPSSS
jgi:hypothetical protein